MNRWTAGIAVLLVGTLMAGRPARAQLNRRHESVKVRGKYKVRSRKSVKRQVAAKQIAAEEFMIAKIKAKVQKIIMQQMRILKRRLQFTPQEDQRYPEYLFRLATLYNEMQNAQWMKAMSLDERIFAAEDSGRKGEANRLRRLKVAYMRAHKQWLTKALLTFRQITVKFPKYSRLDEVYFHISNTAKKLIEREKNPARKEQWRQVMLLYFKKLLQQFPNSKYKPDALLAYAESAFNGGDFGTAHKLYKEITKYRRSPVYPYAIYKIGWIYLNLARRSQDQPEKRKYWGMALTQFLKVLKIRNTKVNLASEARKDIVRTYANIGAPKQAFAFFRRPDVGGPKNVKWMMVMLGDVYYSQGKNDDAVYVYEEVIRRYPRDKNRCKWMLSEVDATINTGNKDKQVVAIKKLGNIWQGIAKQFGAKSPVTKECKSAAANIMRMLATQWHSEAQKTKNFATLDKAQYLYETYLKSFPDNPDRYVMSYYYADLLFLLGDMLPNKANWPKAAAAFTKVLKMKKPPKMSHKQYVKKRNEAALAAVECWMRHFNLTAKKLTQKPKEKEKEKTCAKRKRRKCVKWAKTKCEPKPIPSDLQKMIEAFDTYIRFVPKSKWLVKIMYNKALIYYNFCHYNKALKFFRDIAVKHQDDEEPARFAALRVIAILKMQERYGEMKKYIDEFYKAKGLMADMAFKLKMQEFKRNAMWEEAQALAKKKRFKESGELFEQIARMYPNDSRIDEILWNAATYYEAARLIGAAVRMRKWLRRVKPKSNLASKALYFIGGNYHALAFYVKAAKYYEEFAFEYPKEKEAPKALKWAILFRWGTGDVSKMKDDVAQFIKTYTRYGRKYISEVSQVHFWVSRVYEEQIRKGGRDAQEAEMRLIAHLNQYLSRYRRSGGLDREVEAMAKLGQIYWRKSCKRKMVNGMCVKVTWQRRKRRKKLAHKKKRVRYMQRERRMANAARKKFRAVLSAWGSGKSAMARMPGKTPAEKARRAEAALYWVAMSRFMLADMKFEEYMKLDIPRSLNFDPRRPSVMKRSQKKFAAWGKNKAKGLLRLRGDYEEVIKMKQAHWAIAATARIGMLYHNFARQLYDAPIPTFLRSEEEKDAYRDELQKYADPLEAKAKQGYTLCLATAKKYNWFNEWSRLCEREINELEPERYPLASELRAEPGYVSTRLSPGAVITNLR